MTDEKTVRSEADITAAEKRALSVDTTSTPRDEDFLPSELNPEVEEGNRFDPDGHTRQPDRDPHEGQVGPDNIGNTGISGRPGN